MSNKPQIEIAREEQWAAEARQVLQPLIKLLQDRQEQDDLIERWKQLLISFDTMLGVSASYKQDPYLYEDQLWHGRPYFPNIVGLPEDTFNPFRVTRVTGDSVSYSNNYSYATLLENLDRAIQMLPEDLKDDALVQSVNKLSLNIMTPVDRLLRNHYFFDKTRVEASARLQSALDKYPPEEIAEALVRPIGGMLSSAAYLLCHADRASTMVWNSENMSNLFKAIRRKLLNSSSDDALFFFRQITSIRKTTTVAGIAASFEGNATPPRLNFKRFIQLAPMKIISLLYTERAGVLNVLETALIHLQAELGSVGPARKLYWEEAIEVTNDNVNAFHDFVQALENDPQIYLTKSQDVAHSQMQLELFEAIKRTLSNRLMENSSELTAEQTNIKNKTQAQLMNLHFTKHRLFPNVSLKKGSDAPADDLSIAIGMAKNIDIHALERIPLTHVWIAADLLGYEDETPTTGYNRRVLLHTLIRKSTSHAILESAAPAAAELGSAAAGGNSTSAALDENSASSTVVVFKEVAEAISWLRASLGLADSEKAWGDEDEAAVEKYMQEHKPAAQTSSAQSQGASAGAGAPASGLQEYSFYATQHPPESTPTTPTSRRKLGG